MIFFLKLYASLALLLALVGVGACLFGYDALSMLLLSVFIFMLIGAMIVFALIAIWRE